jgi:hypothetical protein
VLGSAQPRLRRDLPDDDDEVLAAVVSRILSAHAGPGRRFCILAEHLLHRGAAVDSWLRSPALDGFQEIDLGCRRRPRPVLNGEWAKLPPATPTGAER